MRGATAAAYSATGEAWQRGPGRIYDRLAEVVVNRSPLPVEGARALDLGAGTGAGTRALQAAGAREVVALDAAWGMLAWRAGTRPPAVAGDARALPFADSRFDVVVAAFCLNHLTDPGSAFSEAARVTRPGGGLVVSSYAADDWHPVKEAVEAALAARGWKPEPWYEVLRADAAPRLATVTAARQALAVTGLDFEVETVRVPFPGMTAGDLVAWRLGLAQHAPFVAALTSDDDRAALVADATARLGSGWSTLERSIIVVTATTS